MQNCTNIVQFLWICIWVRDFVRASNWPWLEWASYCCDSWYNDKANIYRMHFSHFKPFPFWNYIMWSQRCKIAGVEGAKTVTRNDKNSLIENNSRMRNILFAVAAAYAWWAHRSIHVRIGNVFFPKWSRVLDYYYVRYSQFADLTQAEKALCNSHGNVAVVRLRVDGDLFAIEWDRIVRLNVTRENPWQCQPIPPSVLSSIHHICCGFLFSIFLRCDYAVLSVHICVRPLLFK